MEDDPLIFQLKKTEKGKSKLFSLISASFYYLKMNGDFPIMVRNFSCTNERFNLETMDSKGRNFSLFGYTGKLAKLLTESLTSRKPDIIVCTARSAGVDVDPLRNYLIITDANPSRIMLNSQGKVEEIELINLYPFPYYEGMPIYEKFSVLKVIMGIRNRYLKNDLISLVTKELSQMSLGLSTYELWESIKKLINEGVEANVLSENSMGIKIVGSRFTSRRVFMENYYRYYIRINKTTLYDF
ncbi:MAG: hypothetical protein ACYCSO_06410 [Cuniculiplasma sp.]